LISSTGSKTGVAQPLANSFDDAVAHRHQVDRDNAPSSRGTDAGQSPVAFLGACLKIPERGCVVFDQPQQISIYQGVEKFAACCGWSSTQPRSIFRQALSVVGVAGNVGEFVLLSGRNDQAGRGEAGADCFDGVNDGLGFCPQIHQHVRINGDERPGRGGHSRA
jgi:hypothetical protein